MAAPRSLSYRALTTRGQFEDPIAARPFQQSLRSLLRLALPIALVQVGMMSMGVVDTIIVGHASSAGLGAVALGNLYFFGVSIFGTGVLMALDPVIAQSVGAGAERAVALGLQRGMLLSLVVTALTAVLLVPAEPAFRLLRQPADVVPIAGGWCLATIPGTLPFFIFFVLRQTLQAMGRPNPVVVAILVANVVNAVLAWMLVFGRLGAPAMGAVGSGWATSISRWFMALALIAASWKELLPYFRPFRREAFLRRPLMRMVRIGAPIGMQYQLEFGAFAVIGLLMGWLGTAQMAGHQVAINLASFTFMVPVGVSAAAATLVGQAVGRGDAAEARRAAVAGLVCGSIFMSFTSAAFLLLPGELAGLYTDQADVLRVAATLIPIAGVFQLFDGLQVVGAGILRGAGDTRAPMIVNVVGFWLIGMPVSVYLGFRTTAGPAGLWWGLVAGLGAVAIFLLIRIRFRFRRELRRLVVDEVRVQHS